MVRKQHISQNKELFLNNDDSSSSSNISNKSKIRYLMVRSENYEKQIATLLQSLSLYTRRMAKLRDAGDTIAETLNSISNAEVLNPSSKKAVSEVSKTFRIIQDHRDSEILYLEDKLLPLISEYGEQLQKQREELRTNVGKLFDNNQRGSGLSWIRSSNNSNQSINRRRRSQSVERFGQRLGKEEKSVQQSIQRYELRKNLIFKKLLLKLVLTESRFTIRSFNNLTFCYKHILDEMNPTKDLKFFNEFFKFRSIKKSKLDEMQTVNLNGLVSDNEEEEEDEDEDDEDSGNDNQEHNDLNEDNNNQEDSISIKSERNVSTNRIGKNKEIDNENDDDDAKSLSSRTKSSTVSTLKRFNSTPEISRRPRNESESLKNVNQKKINKDNNEEFKGEDNKKRINLFGKSKTVQKKDQTTLERKMIKKNSKSSSSNSDDNDDSDSDSDLDSDDSDSDTENDIIDEQLDSTTSNSNKKQQKSMVLKSNKYSNKRWQHLDG